MYRHLRKQVFSNPEEESGVRISIPLDRIASRAAEDCLGFAKLVNMHVPLKVDDIHKFDSPPEDSRIKFVIFNKETAWITLRDAIDAAKAKATSEVLSPVVVDFGPLSYAANDDKQSVSSVSTTEEATEAAIRDALALGQHEIWC